MDEKFLMVLGILGSIFLGFIPPIVLWLMSKNSLQANNKEIIRQLLNWEFSIAIVIFVVTFLPTVNIFMLPVLWFVNLFFVVKAYLACTQNTAFKAPGFEFLK